MCSRATRPFGPPSRSWTGGISETDIYNNLVLTQYNETQIIEMSLYWRSAEEGVQI